MEALAKDLPNKLVDTVWRPSAKPAPSGQRHKVVEVPYQHAIPNHRVDVHGVEQCDLADIQRQLGVVIVLGSKKPWEEFLTRDSLHNSLVECFNSNNSWDANLGCANPSIAMAEDYLLCICGHGEIADIRARFATPEDEDGRVFSKLLSGLERR